MNEPAWLSIARRDLGVAETPGKDTTPAITRWLVQLGAWWRDDETPWCGVAVAHWMSEAGVAVPKDYYRARSWLNWGTQLMQPALGCVVVFDRRGGGHVGLVVARSGVFDDLHVLGGNQGDRVSIATFPRERVLGYRWPQLAVEQLPGALPIISASVPVSTSEA